MTDNNNVYSFSKFTIKINLNKTEKNLLITLTQEIIETVQKEVFETNDPNTRWGTVIPLFNKNTLHLMFHLRAMPTRSYRFKKFKSFFEFLHSKTEVISFDLIAQSDDQQIDYFNNLMNSNCELISINNILLDSKI